MANNYTQFSEAIDSITPEESTWIQKVLKETHGDEDANKLVDAELGLPSGEGLCNSYWPDFEWEMEEGMLWLHCEESYDEQHLIRFVQAFIRKFRPDFVFAVTGACTCSHPRIGEFGGWWLVITADKVVGGNTWDAAKEAAAAAAAEAKVQR